MAGQVGFPTEFWANGPQPGSIYNFPGVPTRSRQEPITKTLYPMVTGTSVLGMKFDGGVILAADMLGSYGATARFRNISRVMKVNDSTALAAGGDIADFRFIKSIIEQRVIDEECLNDGFGYTPRSLFSWMTRVMYNRRSKFNPLWNAIIVGGMQDDQPFLGYVNMIGTAYEAPTLASGYGSMIAQPLLREAVEKKPVMTEQEAKELLARCLKVLYYRDKVSLNKYELAIVTKEGVRIEGPITFDTDWSIAHMVKGYE